MVSIRIKRGTRAQLNAAAAASGLAVGEPYLITDENRIAVGLTTSTYEAMAKSSESGGTQITVATTPPASPTLNQLWLDIS